MFASNYKSSSAGSFFICLLFLAQNAEGDPDVVEVTLGPNDRRFGFSVVGGQEEGFPPRIDEIAKGKEIEEFDCRCHEPRPARTMGALTWRGFDESKERHALIGSLSSNPSRYR